MGCCLYQNSLLARHLENSLGICESSGHLRKSQWTFDVNHNFRDATTVRIYESIVDIYVNLTGRYCVNCSGHVLHYGVPFVSKFISGRHLEKSGDLRN